MQAPKAVKEVKTPADLGKMLSSSSSLQTIWKNLTPVARRDFITWVESAKQPETRARRIEVTRSKLVSGTRRPCCYAVVPMSLYKALSETPKAKAVWKELTPMGRRDFVSWVEEEKESAPRALRIEKACTMLAQGKLYPVK